MSLFLQNLLAKTRVSLGDGSVVRVFSCLYARPADVSADDWLRHELEPGEYIMIDRASSAILSKLTSPRPVLDDHHTLLAFAYPKEVAGVSSPADGVPALLDAQPTQESPPGGAGAPSVDT